MAPEIQRAGSARAFKRPIISRLARGNLLRSYESSLDSVGVEAAAGRKPAAPLGCDWLSSEPVSATLRSIYVSAGATQDQVRGAVDSWMREAGIDYPVDVEFGDEYPGFVTAVDLYKDDRGDAEQFARALMTGLRERLPGAARIALDLDLEATARAQRAAAGIRTASSGRSGDG